MQHNDTVDQDLEKRVNALLKACLLAREKLELLQLSKNVYHLFTAKNKDELNIISGWITLLEGEGLPADKLTQLAKSYHEVRDILEEDPDTKESRVSYKITDALLESMLHCFCPPLWILAPVIFPLFLRQSGIKEKEIYPAQILAQDVNKELSKQIIPALENECHAYIRQLNAKKEKLENALRIIEENLSSKFPPVESLKAKKILEENRSKLTQHKAKYQEKLNNLTKKIEDITYLQNILKEDRKTDDTKFKEFNKYYSSLEKSGGSLAGKDKRVAMFFNTIRYILATAFTLGLYAESRIKYASETRGTARFWQSKSEVFKTKVKKKLNQHIKNEKKKNQPK